MAPNPDPTRSVAQLDVRKDDNTLLVSISAYTDAWELVIEATIPSVAVVTIPDSGTFRIRCLISASCNAEKILSRSAELVESVVVLATPGNVAIPTCYNEAIRSIYGNNVTLNFEVSIEKFNGVDYDRYARGLNTIVVSPQSTRIATFQLMAQRQVLDGSNAYMRDPSDFKKVMAWYQDVGIQWVRFSYPWSYAEELAQSVITEPYATKLQSIITDIHSRGLKICALISGVSPCWASTRGGKDCTTFTGRFDQTTALAAPSDWLLFEDFVKRFVNTYHPDAVEADNEPNTANYASLGVTPAAFVNRLTHLYNGVKASNYPNTPVLSPALSLADTAYLQQLYDAGMKTVCDVVAIHPYDVVLLNGNIFTANVSTDVFTTLSPHGYKQNERQVLNVQGGSLPVPLTPGTVYYVQYLTPTTFQLSLRPNGTPIIITSTGSGTMTAGWTFRQADPRMAGSPSDSARMQGSFVQGSHRIHKVMRANGDGAKPIWITEWGITTNSSFILPVDDKTKGEHIDAAMRLADRIPYVEVMGLYTLVEPSGSSGTGFGSINAIDQKLGSYTRLKNVLAALAIP